MVADKYEVMINDILKSAEVVDHSKNPCNGTLIPKNKVLPVKIMLTCRSK